MNDFTTYLLSLAGISTAIVSILGGFIFSRHINIITERSGLIDELDKLTSRINELSSERKKFQELNSSEEINYFIWEHLSLIMSENEEDKTLNKVYMSIENPSVSIEDVLPYWEKAITVWNRYNSLSDDEKRAINDHDVPNVLELQYREDEFSYMICNFIALKLYSPGLRPFFCDKYMENVSRLDVEIENLNSHKEGMCDIINNISKPKGLKFAVILFALFAVSCVMAPLICITCVAYSSSFASFKTAQIAFTVVFSLFLIAVFIYIVWLMRWKKIKS